jgi:hypothetical protein
MATRLKLDRLIEQIEALSDKLQARNERPRKFFELICEEGWDDDRIQAELTAKYPGEYPGGPNDKTVLWRIVSPSAHGAPDPRANHHANNRHGNGIYDQ